MAIISNGTTIASGGSLSVSANPPTSLGSVGTYGFMKDTVSNEADVEAGNTVSGSNIRYSNGNATTGNASAPSGTWRLMGFKANPNGGTPRSKTTLCVRIS